MLNQIGSYGSWAAGLLDKGLPALSLRTGKFKNVAAWRKLARRRVWDLLAAPPQVPTPKVRVVARGTYDGLAWEKLSWKLPYGPATEAVLLKPANAKPGARLPGILALHDHGGRKYFGWRKIAQIDDVVHPLMLEHRDECYDALAWANEAARRGYAVLCHDTFLFGSRRVHVRDVLPHVRGEGTDPGSDERTSDIKSYNQWAGNHEHLVAKSLFSAGTTWPALFLRDDQAALSVLCARKDVDARRVGCGGLSGGGLRTVFLAGMDDRIRSCFCAGFFTTWKDLVLFKAWTHTWMTYLPLLPRDLDFPEILGLRAPLPTLVLNCDSDPLFTTSEARRAAKMLQDVYKRAGARDAFRFSMYPGGHQLDRDMQKEAFEWLDASLQA
jgi:dienelactone hydrolase